MSYFKQKRLYSPNFSGRTHTSSSSHYQYGQPNKKKKVVFWLLATFIFVVVVFGVWFTRNILIGLPDVSKINDMVFNEATIIEDRNWEVLYKLFEENREYVPYSWISLNMINAIVALEDQRYREHNGLDAMGMLRAAISAVINPGSRVQWASTIPQQLVRNLLLTQDRKITRKIKEILLTSKLSGVLENMIRKWNSNLSPAQLRKEMKDRTLELYLNYISFGNNAFGIEAAAKTYFSKSAKDLTVLESSILASIPKGPSLYNPYKNRDLVVGAFVVKDSYGNPVLFSGDVQRAVTDKFTQILTNADLSNKKSNNAVVKFIDGIWSFTINISGTNLEVKYTNGRKDLALDKMYENGYITEQELKDAIIQGINYVFRANTFPIKAPHFVQWVIEELEKTYGSGTLMKGWFVVKTTLDSKIQQVAEEAILANNSTLQSHGANNSAMIYLDSKNGDVLAYVWSIDYFNTTIQWQNDMIRKPRQTGSAIKPFIYALGLETLPLTLDTPIFDIPFKIGKDQPNDADDKFEGMLPLKKALGHSRNIPAAKMFTAIGGEVVAKPFLKKLGLTSLDDNIEYWYPLALWAGEVTMLEFANAYAHISTDTPAVINPILEIRSRDGSILYQKTWWNYQPEVIKPGIRSLLRKILSDTENRIIGITHMFDVSWLAYGLKTWTSDVKTDKWNRPRDWWLVGYTPSKVAIIWAGNADASPMYVNAFGEINAAPIKKLFWWLLKNNYITNEQMPNIDTVSVSISKVSGKAASATTPADLTVSTLKYKNSPGLASDDWATPITFDGMCNWLVSPYTVPGDVKNGYLIVPNTFMPNGMDLAEITQWWNESTAFMSGGVSVWWVTTGRVTYTFNNIFVQMPVQMCPGRDEKPDTNIQVNLGTPTTNSTIWSPFTVSYTINGPKNIRKVLVLLNNQQIGLFDYPQWDTKSITDTKQIPIPTTGFKNWSYTLELVAFDFAWFSNKVSIPVTFTLGTSSTPSDTTAPKIMLSAIKVTKNASGTYDVVLPLDEESGLARGKITRNWITLYEYKGGNTANFTMDSLGPVVVSAADTFKNTLNQTIDLSVYLAQ